MDENDFLNVCLKNHYLFANRQTILCYSLSLSQSAFNYYNIACQNTVASNLNEDSNRINFSKLNEQRL